MLVSKNCCKRDKLSRDFFLCESRSCSVLTACGAPVGREEVSARAVLLRIGLAALRLSLYTYGCTSYRLERVVALLDRTWRVRVRGRARERWVDPPEAG